MNIKDYDDLIGEYICKYNLKFSSTNDIVSNIYGFKKNRISFLLFKTFYGEMYVRISIYSDIYERLLRTYRITWPYEKEDFKSFFKILSETDTLRFIDLFMNHIIGFKNRYNLI